LEDKGVDRQAMMSIPYKDSGIPVYFTCKDGGTRPMLILIHEVWGLNDHIKDIANRLCEEGFMVLAPDLVANTDLEKVVDPSLQKVIFDEKEKLKHQVEIRRMWTPLRSPDFAETTISKLETCFDYLSSLDAAAKIGVIGFCFGGTYSFNLAVKQPELAAAVPFYGHFDHTNEELGNIKCPILAFYGERDTNLTESLPDLEKRMKKANKDFDYKVYPKCGHAFFNDTNPLSYNKPAAEDSWKLALKFLNTHLS
jgi:carboxymethylenebutenolidase